MEPHDLYGLPLEQFTEARNTLARNLRRAGRRDEAATVAKLRKPSVAAWAVNQLVRTQKREVDALLDAGDALQKAQANVVARRGDAAALRRSAEAERTAVQRLADRARGLLNSDGHELTPARLEQVAETLQAAALDPDARAKVSGGCLERELRHIGLGGLGAAPQAPQQAPQRASRAKPEKPPKREKRPQRGAASRTEPDGARSEAIKAARQAEAAARRRLEAAQRQLRTAAQRRERAAGELRDAEAALEAARERSQRAEQEHRAAKERLDES